jgi:hypothetical protein
MRFIGYFIEIGVTIAIVGLILTCAKVRTPYTLGKRPDERDVL